MKDARHRKRVSYLILSFVFLLLILIIALSILLLSVDENKNPLDSAPPALCIKSSAHKCLCPSGQEFEILIDDYSVKLGLKYFEADEIVRLKQLHGSK